MSWLILGLFMFVPGIPSFFRLMKLAHDQSVITAARRAELKLQCDRISAQEAHSLVPKLHLGTRLSAQLRCLSRAEAKLLGQVRSQVQLGNEGKSGSTI